MTMRMVADHAVRPVENDTIFTISAKANEAVAKKGANNVINASMGVLLEDDGKFVAFEAVYNHLKSLEDKKIAAYASIEGDHDFLKAVQEACFKDCRPKGYIQAIATPGGSGAIHHAIFNYTNIGDSVITTNLYWDPYKTICQESGRKLQTFNFFTDEGTFDIKAFKDKFNLLLNKQKRVLTILNTPAHNPTGYSISDNEWDEILNTLKEASKDKENKIILLVDVAYLDFCEDKANRREFMKKFSDLPENILILIAFSASKGYTMYGLRNGAIICISSSEEVSKEFYYTNLHSNRGTWSNGTKSAMRVLTDITNDKELNKIYKKQKDYYVNMLANRANEFLKACKEVSLETTPYKDGFFICIPCKDPVKICDELMKKDLFVVPLQTGLRFALCAVSMDKCKISPRIIKEAIDNYNG